MSVPVESPNEQILQDLLRQKLNGSTEIAPLPAGELMEEFHAELSILSNEFIHQRGESHHSLTEIETETETVAKLMMIRI